MTKLGLIDLEILFLGIKGNGDFNEKDLENSDLKRLGVGRILDSLASLKDRKLINQNKDGSFFVTDTAKHTLWDEQVPLWVRILRLLQIKSFTEEEISVFLKKQEQEIIDNIEKLRKNQLILMAPQKTDSKIIKVYEILPEGIERLKEVEKEGTEKINLEKIPNSIEIQSAINQIIREVNDLEISSEKKENITSKLTEVIKKIEN